MSVFFLAGPIKTLSLAQSVFRWLYQTSNFGSFFPRARPMAPASEITLTTRLSSGEFSVERSMREEIMANGPKE